MEEDTLNYLSTVRFRGTPYTPYTRPQGRFTDDIDVTQIKPYDNKSINVINVLWGGNTLKLSNVIKVI